MTDRVSPVCRLSVERALRVLPDTQNQDESDTEIRMRES